MTIEAQQRLHERLLRLIDDRDDDDNSPLCILARRIGPTDIGCMACKAVFPRSERVSAKYHQAGLCPRCGADLWSVGWLEGEDLAKLGPLTVSSEPERARINPATESAGQECRSLESDYTSGRKAPGKRTRTTARLRRSPRPHVVADPPAQRDGPRAHEDAAPERATRATPRRRHDRGQSSEETER